MTTSTYTNYKHGEEKLHKKGKTNKEFQVDVRGEYSDNMRNKIRESIKREDIRNKLISDLNLVSPYNYNSLTNDTNDKISIFGLAHKQFLNQLNRVDCQGM